MKIIPIMIQAIYNKKEDVDINKFLPIEDIVELHENQSFYDENGIWNTYNHFRHNLNEYNSGYKTGYGQIGFVIDDLPENGTFRLYIKGSNLQADVEMNYYHEKKIWYERSIFKKNKEFAKHFIGNNTAGHIVPIIKDHHNRLVFEGNPIKILPSSFSEENYNVMLSEISQMSTELIFYEKSHVKVNYKKRNLIENLGEIIKQLRPRLKVINNNPEEDLILKIAHKKTFHRPSRYDPHEEFERNVFPGKQRIKTRITSKDLGTYENRMIKRFLINIQWYLNLISEDSLNMRNESFENEIKSITSKNEFLKEFTETDYLDNILNIEKMEKDKKEELTNLIRVLTRMDKEERKLSSPEEYIEIELNFLVNNSMENSRLGLSDNKQYLISRFESTYTEKKWTLQLDSYSYTYKNQEYIINRKSSEKFSQKFLLNLYSADLGSHFLIKKVLQDKKNIGQKVTIKGKAKIQTSNQIDFIAKPSNKNNNYNDYIFDFVNKVEIHINNQEQIRCCDNIAEELTKIILFDKHDSDMHRRMKNTTYKQVEQLKENQNRVSLDRMHILSLNNDIEELLSLDFLKKIIINKNESLVQSQRFLHHSQYRAVWEVLKENNVVYDFNYDDEILENGIRDANEVYEIWIFIKMIYLFITDLKFVYKSNRNITQEIFSYFRKKKSLNGFCIRLEQGDYSLYFTYNPQINIYPNIEKNHNQFFRPDYQMKFLKNNGSTYKKTKTIYIDAKNRNYAAQGNNQWISDIKDVAIGKYMDMVPIEEDDIASASFIIHSDIETGRKLESDGYIYNSTYHKEFQSFKNEEGHWTGSIYFLPQATHTFMIFFRMIMEYHFDDYSKCWKCGTFNNIGEEIRYTKRGHKKYYYTCNNCNDFWVKTHCVKRHKLIKHTNNYHKQKSKNEEWYVICPICHDGK